jgi:hypothetical protein
MLTLFGIVGFLIALTSVSLGVGHGLTWADLHRVGQKRPQLVSLPVILGLFEAFSIFSALQFARNTIEDTPPIGWLALIMCAGVGALFLQEFKKLTAAAVEEKEKAQSGAVEEKTPIFQKAFRIETTLEEKPLSTFVQEKMENLKTRASGPRD